MHKLSDDHEVVLNNSKIISSSPNSFTLRGNLTNEKYLNSKDIKLFLMNNGEGINAACKTEANLQKNANCDLICTMGKTANTDLNMTLGFMPDDEFLLIDFDENETSVIDHTKDYQNQSHHRSKKGLSTGGIIAIIVPCVLVLLGVTALAFAYKKTPPPPQGVALGNNTLGAANSSTNVVTN